MDWRAALYERVDRVVRLASSGGPSWPVEVVLVMGNEAADVDSVVSAVAGSVYFDGGRSSGGGSGRTRLAVPVFNVPRGELPLRRDCEYVLGVVLGLDVSRCGLFLEEFGRVLESLDGDGGGGGGCLRVLMVDHNRLSVRQERRLAPLLCGVIDHHSDDGLYLGPGDPELEPRIVVRVGSTCTLMSELLLGRRGDEQPHLAVELAAALYCGIVLDTGNMSPELGAGTPRDAAALGSLRPLAEQALGAAEARPDVLLEKLLALRRDIAGLGPDLLLLKDVKFATVGRRSVAVSSVPLALDQWAHLGLEPALRDLLRRHGLQLAVVMTAFQDATTGGPGRELLLFAQDERDEAALRTLLESSDLRLRRIDPAPAGAPGAVYVQQNVSASRKVVLPLLCQALSRL